MINRVINNKAVSLVPDIRIYIATEDDVEHLLPLVHSFNKESNRNLDINDAGWADFWRRVISKDLGCAFYAADRRYGKPVGLIMAMSMPSHLDQELEVTETLWFVSEPYRKSNIGMQLLDALESFAEMVGATRINVTHLANNTGARIAKVFARRGYQAAECGYFKEVQA